jgi:O-antigen/teichoic acid export membrane protein
VQSTVSNYVFLFVRLVVGLLLTRVLFQGLSRQEYGFWVLTWSVFGYALVLDFGFGSAVQKYASQATVHGEWNDFVRRFNTVFAVYCAMGLVVALTTFASLPLLPLILHLEASDSQVANFRWTFLLFGLGRAALFPFSVFAEVLTGLQRIHHRNLFLAASTVVTALLLGTAVHFRAGLVPMVLVSFTVESLAILAMAAYVKNAIPEFRLAPGLFDRRLFRSIVSFSVFAYLTTLSHLVILQTDELVITVFLSLSLVGVYHVVWRVSNLYQQISTQLLDGLGPVAAVLFQSQEHEALKRTLLQSGRAVGTLGTMFFVPLVVYLKPLLKIWLDLENQAAYEAGLLLLAATYMAVLFKGTAARILLMCGAEKALAALAVLEAVLNLGLTIAFCVWSRLGIVGVALGTLLPIAVLAVVAYVPLACRWASVSTIEYLKVTLSGASASGVVAAVVCVLCLRAAPPTSLLGVLLNSIPGLLAFVGGFAVLGLNGDERALLWSLLRGNWAAAVDSRR